MTASLLVLANIQYDSVVDGSRELGHLECAVDISIFVCRSCLFYIN